MIKKTKHSKGFMLIELVLVAGIISLLSSFVLATLDASRSKGRDAKKISELKSLQTALELYHVEYNTYPEENVGLFRNGAAGNDMTPALNILVSEKFISAIPTPPKGSLVPGGDTYFYQTADIPGVEPSCNGKRIGQTLGQVPYIIYYVTEQPHQNLPTLVNHAVSPAPIINGHCLTL